MNKILAFVLFALIGCGKSSEKSEVIIGDQTWMTKNLDVTTFRNGEPILEAKTKEEWENAEQEEKPAWCYYDFNSENKNQCGKFYNWYAVQDERGLAPKGWHIPTSDEFNKTFTSLSEELNHAKAGPKLKSTEGWQPNNDCTTKNLNPNGTNESGFSARPCGYCSGDSRYFSFKGYEASWWVYIDSKTSFGQVILGSCTYGPSFIGGELKFNKYNGHSVRCVADKAN